MSIDRRRFIHYSCAAAAASMLPLGSWSARGGTGGGALPNIVVIVSDDQTPSYLGCYGGRTPTPHLDRLASEGVRCTRAYAVTPLCNPSRYSLLAGQYPGRNAKVIDRTPPGEPYHLMQSTDWTAEDPSIARTLKSAGYYTGYVGKWHSNFELEGGLDYPAGMDKDDPATSRLLAERHAQHAASIAAIGGFDHVGNLQVGNLGGKKNTMPWLAHHNPEWQTQGALDFIDQASSTGKPFFLHLANSIPHAPDNLETLDQDNRYTFAGRLEEPLTCHPPRATVRERMRAAELQTEGPIGSINAGSIMLDDQLAAVRAKLEKAGVADNTLIIWLADHSIYGKGACYAAGTHVPLIAHWPGQLPAGSTCETPVSLVDLFRTCAAAGSASVSDAVDGEDLLPILRGTSDSHGPVYIEANWFRSVIVDRYHYVAFRPPGSAIASMESGAADFAVDWHRRGGRNHFGDLNLPFKPHYFDPDQLYDLEADPFERHNLAGDPARADTLSSMQTALAGITTTFGRPFDLAVHPFLQSERYGALAERRHALALEGEHYPEGHDAERIFNLNLPDPLVPMP